MEEDLSNTNSAFNGGHYLNTILERNSTCCKEILRMDKQVLMDLYSYARNKGLLQNSQYIFGKEKIAMFFDLKP